MKVIKFPDTRLFVPCKDVTVFGPELAVLLETMWETMVAEGGIGLAANQVGLGYRMFVMEGAKKDEKSTREKIFLVNPKILSKSEAPANLKEGCLSAPGEFLVLPERASWTQVQYQTEAGATITRVFHGIYSVCVQHEIDHLNGKSHLLSKSLPKVTRKALAKKWGIKLK